MTRPMMLLLLLGLWVCAAARWWWEVSQRVGEPYMDEIFHVAQAQRYCAGRWTEWDPKITTLPGLYLVPAIVAPVCDWCCSLDGLRLLNVVFGMGLLSVLYAVVPLVNPGLVRYRWLKVLEIGVHPLVWFYLPLYYTDIGSTFTVIFCWYLALLKYHLFASFVGAFAVVFRQNNIIWVAFVAADALIREFEQEKKKLDIPVRQYFPEELAELPRAVLLFVQWCLRNKFHILRVYAGFITVAIGCVAFVVVNGGVVVGDRENHIACWHFPQLFYFAISSFGFLGFGVINLTVLRRTIFSFRNAFSTNLGRVSLIAVFALGALAILRFTYVHPFLLADNRHYTFYIWRRVIAFHPLSRYALLPLYLFALAALRHVFGSQKSWLWLLMFSGCVAAVLVPSPLLEFRYFVLPFIIVQLHEHKASPALLTLNVLGNIAINTAVCYLFLYRQFEWNDGSVARFMW